MSREGLLGLVSVSPDPSTLSFKTSCAHTFPSPYKMAPGEWSHIMTMTKVPAARTTCHPVYSTYCVSVIPSSHPWASAQSLGSSQPLVIPTHCSNPTNCNSPLLFPSVFLSFRPLPSGYLFSSRFLGLGFNTGDCWFSGMGIGCFHLRISLSVMDMNSNRTTTPTTPCSASAYARHY